MGIMEPLDNFKIYKLFTKGQKKKGWLKSDNASIRPFLLLKTVLAI